jgi:hypothetical protein
MVIAILILVILAITLPALVSYIQSESRWTVKEQHTTKSYQLAEAAVEHGHQKLLISTSTWDLVQAGTPVPDFDFDNTFTGVSGGSYQIQYAAGPSVNQITITGVGRATTSDGSTDVRAIRVIYTNGSAGTTAITAGKAVSLGASVNVEWGGIISYTSIDPGGRTHPRFYSAGAITGYDSSSAAPNTDNVLYWAYETDLPSMPQVDLQFYKNKAISQGANPNPGCPAYYAAVGPGNVNGCIDTGDKTYYYDSGDWTWRNPGPNFIQGNIILATGNMSISGNGGTGAVQGAYNWPIPPRAWEEYGKSSLSWDVYQCMDGFANANFATYQDAVDADYTAAVNEDIPSACLPAGGTMLLHGFIYAGGGSGLSGGGNSRFHGAIMTPNTASATTSNFTIYFDENTAATIRTVGLNLTRASWRELSNCSWTGATASCP